MAIVNTVDKRIAKCTIGLLVATRGVNPDVVAEGVERRAAETGLQLGDLSTLSALTRYAWGVAEKGERVSNRRWAEYPKPIAQAARKLADEVYAELA